MHRQKSDLIHKYIQYILTGSLQRTSRSRIGSSQPRNKLMRIMRHFYLSTLLAVWRCPCHFGHRFRGRCPRLPPPLSICRPTRSNICLLCFISLLLSPLDFPHEVVEDRRCGNLHLRLLTTMVTSIQRSHVGGRKKERDVWGAQDCRRQKTIGRLHECHGDLMFLLLQRPRWCKTVAAEDGLIGMFRVKVFHWRLLGDCGT